MQLCSVDCNPVRRGQESSCCNALPVSNKLISFLNLFLLIFAPPAKDLKMGSFITENHDDGFLPAVQKLRAGGDSIFTGWLLLLEITMGR